MSQKKEAIELIQRLPDDVTMSDIMEELYFKQQVDRGLQDVMEGRTVSSQELKGRMIQWQKPAGR